MKFVFVSEWIWLEVKIILMIFLWITRLIFSSRSIINLFFRSIIWLTIAIDLHFNYKFTNRIVNFKSNKLQFVAKLQSKDVRRRSNYRRRKGFFLNLFFFITYVFLVFGFAESVPRLKIRWPALLKIEKQRHFSALFGI